MLKNKVMKPFTFFVVFALVPLWVIGEEEGGSVWDQVVPASEASENNVSAMSVPAADKTLIAQATVPEFKSKNTKADRIIMSRRKIDKDLELIFKEVVPSMSEPFYYDGVKVVRKQRRLMKPPEITRTQERNATKRAERKAQKAVPAEKPQKKSREEIKLLEEENEKRAEFLKKLHAFNNLPLDNVKPHPAAKTFPGSVPEKATRVAITYTAKNKIRGWQCTGAYAPPGEVIRVRVAKGGVNRGYKIRIGAHTDNLEGGIYDNAWSRFPLISRETGIGNDSIEIVNPFGGMIYVWAPAPPVKRKIVTSSQARVPERVRFRFVGVVEAPVYRLDDTKMSEWEKLRNAPAPWAQLEGEYFKAVVPASTIRNLKDPKELVVFWDKVIAYLDKAIGRKKPLEDVEYILFDADSNSAGGHAGHEIVLPLADAENFSNLEQIKQEGSWPAFFYLAKNRVSRAWTLYHNDDAAAALLAMCCMKQFTERPLTDFIDVPALQTQAFEKPKRSFTPELLGMYAPLIEKFGTEVFMDLLAEFRKAAKANIETEVERADVFITTWSQLVKMNLGPYFEQFGFKYNEQIKARVGNLPEFKFDFENKEKTREDGWIGAFPPNGISIYFSDYNPPIDMSGRTKYAAGTPEEIEDAESRDSKESEITELSENSEENDL